MKNILFITNGHGEDLVAAELSKILSQAYSCTVLPLVGEGQVFNQFKVEVIGPRKKMPSGGFALRNLGYLFQDIFSGLIGQNVANYRLLKSLRGRFDLVVAIGDIVPLLAALTSKTRFIFIGVNKSSYYHKFGHNYTVLEKHLLRKYAAKVYVRDKITEDDLLEFGFAPNSVAFVGNPLMDCFASLPRAAGSEPETKVIGFLPGTRDDAHLNAEDFTKIVEEIIKVKNSDFGGLRFPIATSLKNIPKYFQQDSFAKVLADSDVIVGLSGTGNEQAAGSGVPLVAFYGRGSQYNKRFAEAQKQLLGDALSLVRDNDPLTVAAEVWQLLRNPAKLKAMALAGKERMGQGGAIKKIAAEIKHYLTKNG